jgi:hypothetical protein
VSLGNSAPPAGLIGKPADHPASLVYFPLTNASFDDEALWTTGAGSSDSDRPARDEAAQFDVRSSLAGGLAALTGVFASHLLESLFEDVDKRQNDHAERRRLDDRV